MPNGHRRCGHRPAGRSAEVCERAEWDINLRAAALPLWCNVATLCEGLGLASPGASRLAAEARREDNSLDIIVASSGPAL